MIWTPRVTVAAIIEHEDRYLFVQERIDGELVLNQPAGHLEKGESLQQAVCREVREETARRFEPEGLVGVYRWPMQTRDLTYLRFCFHGSVGKPRPDLSLDADIHNTLWLTYEELVRRKKELRSPMVIQCLNDARNRPTVPLEYIKDVD